MSKQAINLTAVLFFILVMVAGAGPDLVGADARAAVLNVNEQEHPAASAALPKA